MTRPPDMLSRSDFITALTTTYLFKPLMEADVSTLHADGSMVALSQGQFLFREGDPSDALYILLSGRLQATQPSHSNDNKVLGDIDPGDVVGEMQILVGGARTADVSALQDALLIRLPKIAIETLVDRFPKLAETLNDLVVQRMRDGQLNAMLPGVFGSSDETMLETIQGELEWVRLRRGEVLFRQGDEADGMYIVVSGSLHVTADRDDDTQDVIDHVSRGHCVGEMAILSGEPRSADVRAVRRCELAKFSKSAFERVVATHPRLMRAMTNILTRRLQSKLHASPRRPTAINVAIVAVSDKVPLAEFTKRLHARMSLLVDTGHLDADRVDDLMGRQNAAQMAPEDHTSLRLSARLDELEGRWAFVLYEADPHDTQWTSRCIQRADRILLVADATEDPAISDIEATHMAMADPATLASQTIVLIHPETTHRPSGTADWLDRRHIDDHHHLRWNQDADVDRLARHLSGRAVGLVFSGGGARGFAHFGVYLALKEAGIPVDMVGGTSMGAVVAVQCAMQWSRETMLRINRDGFHRKKIFKQYTLPLFSLINARKLDRSLRLNYAGCIEDLWTRYFCIACDLTQTRPIEFRRGPIWKAVRSSIAIPGVLEPMVSENGHLLVDGGIVNNLPTDIMRRHCGTVISVDVTRLKELRITGKAFPSPWTVLLNRLLPMRQPATAPSILDVLMGATTINLREKSKQVIAISDLYLRPPLEAFGMLDFSALETLVDIGYRHAKEEIDQWQHYQRHFPWQPRKSCRTP